MITTVPPGDIIPRSTTAISLTSNMALMNFFPFAQIGTVSPRLILFVAGV
ncbi:MAG: hypothetical protein LJE70_21245 [Chromatiaceae bacterium]|nr:hypothetical protein [Chromatiaceae bacterium]